MDPAHTSFDLSQQGDWLGDMARKLARSESDAEDLVQQTFLAALQARLPDVRNPRSWLSATLCNAARQKYRAQLRHEEHERLAAESEAAAGGDGATSEPSELLEALYDAIQALREPYRSVVHLRYACGLAPSRIAERLSVPVATVTTRLRRAHQILRDRLDRRGRSRGCAGIAVLWARLRSALDERFSARAFGAVALLAAAGLILEGSLSWRASRPVLGPPGIDATGSSEAAPRESSTVSVAVASRRELLSHRTPPPGASPRVTVEGVVVDPLLRPLGGVRVRFEEGATRILPGLPPWFAAESSGAPSPATTSRPDGSFSLAVPAGAPGRAVAEDDHFAAVVTEEQHDRALRGSDLVLVSARRRSIRGRVVDELGRPCAGALVVFLPPRPLGHESADSVVVRPATSSDEGGAFALEAFEVEGARLHASHPLFGETQVAVEESGLQELQLVAHRSGRKLRGRVIDLAGRGVRAHVAVNGRIRSTDAAGIFALDLPADEEFEVVEAVASGALPGGWTRPGTAGTRPPVEVTIRLGGRPKTISGRVLDENGDPRAGILVWVADPSPFGFENRPWFVEGLIQSGREYPVPSATDHEGKFCIGGLLERDYTLRAVDRRTLRVAEARSVAGEVDVAIVFDESFPLSAWSGHVVAVSGNAVEGARVVVGTPAIESTLPWRRAPVRFDVDALSVWSADGGRVTLPAFEPSRAFLRVTGPDVYPTEVHGLPRNADEIVVPMRAPTRFDLAGARPDDRLDIYDRDGVPVHAIRRWVGLDPLGPRVNEPFTAADAIAGSFDLPETAAVLVVSRDGDTLHRQPMFLRPGEVNRVSIDPSFLAAP